MGYQKDDVRLCLDSWLHQEYANLTIDYRARHLPSARPGLLVMTGEAHAQRRRLWNRALSTEAIRSYDASLGKRMAELTSKITSCGESFDITSLIVAFTYGCNLIALQQGHELTHSLPLDSM